MRKLLLLLALILIGVSSVFAEEVLIDGLWYNLSGTTAEVIQHKDDVQYAGNIVIPSTVKYSNNDYNVTKIGSNAFFDCKDLTSIFIPNNVTSIGGYAFYGCSGLTSIEYPNNMTSIGEWAFCGCNSLTSIEIPNSVTCIGEFAFELCSSLASITIGNSVDSIGEWAFSWCGSLETIIVEEGNTKYDSRNNCNAIIETSSNALIAGCKNTMIPNSVTSIGKYAFAGSSGLTFISIPNSVISIEDEAFFGCASLNSITIPKSVKSIGIGSFASCSGLEAIVVEEENTKYDSRNNCNAIVEISSNVLVAGCKNTVIPNSVMKIGGYAFYGCSGLTSIFIPNNVTSIGGYAFYGCSGLTSIEYPNNMTSIGEWAFCGCAALTSIEIPNSITCIEQASFFGCIGLTSIKIPNGVTSIESNAFNGCSGLTTVIIGNYVKSIGSNAFSNCNSLADVYCFAKTVPSTDFYSFSRTPIDHITLHVPIASMNSYQSSYPWNSFKDVVAITEVQIDSIWYQLYESIAEVVSSENDISPYSGDIVIPKLVRYKNTHYTVTSIAPSAFADCSNVTSITIPNSVMEIGESAFSGCSSLNSISIPNNITYIRESTFANCCKLPSITIPNSLTYIGDYAFDNCNSLTSVKIGNSVTTIGDGAFYKCSKLSSITIPNSVTGIGSYTFYKCSDLTFITIGNSMTNIGEYAFAECNSLTDVYIYTENVPTTHIYTFDETPISNIMLHVPAYSINAYKNYYPWSNFKAIVALTDSDPKPDRIKAIEFKKLNEGSVYDLSGRRLAAPLKGINIIDGKKRIVK